MGEQEGHTEAVALLESLMHLRGTCVLSRVTDRVTKQRISSICTDEEAEALSRAGLPKFRLGEAAKPGMGGARKKGWGRGSLLGAPG